MTDAAPTTLLLVDDEPTLREPLAEYLTGQGFVVHEADSAAAARSWLARASADLVLLDIMMPGEDGLSLCRHLVEARDLPVILLTARGEATDRIVGLEIGADDYVTKPFEPRELVARIRSVLRRAERAPPAPGEDFVYRFEGWELDPLKRKLIDPEGATIHGKCSTATACSISFRGARRNCSTAQSTIRSAVCAARSKPTAASRS